MRDRSPLSPFAYRSAVAGVAAFTLLVAGCTSGVPITTSLIPTQQRWEAADAAIAEAVDAYNKGSQTQGDAALNRAVVLLTVTLNGAFSDQGFIETAKRVAAKGRPQDAVRLLEPLTLDKSVARDPLLWGVLSSVAKQAGNAPRSEVAAKEAEKRAADVLTHTGGPKLKQADALAQADLFIRTGQYFDECVREYPKALQAFREARRLLPDAPETANALGYELADRGTTAADFTEAVQLTDIARGKGDDNPEFMDSYGWSLFKRNDTKLNDLAAARRVLREAVDLAPSIPECRYHLSVVYEKLGLFEDAEREAERAIALRPDYAEAIALRDKVKPKVVASPSPTPSPTSSPLPVTSPSPTASPIPSPSASPAP